MPELSVDCCRVVGTSAVVSEDIELSAVLIHEHTGTGIRRSKMSTYSDTQKMTEDDTLSGQQN